MVALIYAGQALVAGTGLGQLNQTYEQADVNTTAVAGTSFANLSTLYTIPAGEPYALAAYSLRAEGDGSWGSTPQALTLAMAFNGTQEGNQSQIASAAFAAGASFAWWLEIEATCVDGISTWQASIKGGISQTANALNPGTAADNSIVLAGVVAGGFTKSVSSAISVAAQAKWASATGAPSITSLKTTWRKVA